MATIMNELCLHLLTKVNVVDSERALDKIWSVENWNNKLQRVLNIEVLNRTERYQRFILKFDAGNESPDFVEVERTRMNNSILVSHITPPPGVNSLTAKWWYETDIPQIIFARRTLLISAEKCSSDKIRYMFGVLRDNLIMLVNEDD